MRLRLSVMARGKAVLTALSRRGLQVLGDCARGHLVCVWNWFNENKSFSGGGCGFACGRAQREGQRGPLKVNRDCTRDSCGLCGGQINVGQFENVLCLATMFGVRVFGFWTVKKVEDTILLALRAALSL